MERSVGKRTEGLAEDGIFDAKPKEISLQKERQDILLGIKSSNDQSRTVWVHRSLGKGKKVIRGALPEEGQVTEVHLIEAYNECPRLYQFMQNNGVSIRRRSIETTFNKAVEYAVKVLLRAYSDGHKYTAKTAIDIMYEMVKHTQSQQMFDAYYQEATNKIIQFVKEPLPRSSDIVDASMRIITNVSLDESDKTHLVSFPIDALIISRRKLIAAYVYYKEIPWYASTGVSMRSMLMLNAAKYISKLEGVYKYSLEPKVGLMDIYSGNLIVYSARGYISDTLDKASDIIDSMNNDITRRVPGPHCLDCKFLKRCYGGEFYQPKAH